MKKKIKCTVNWCTKESSWTGLCQRHYRIKRRKGSIVKTFYDMTPLERLLSKSKKNRKTGCLQFTGKLNKWRYGGISVNGVFLLAHRAAWILSVGDIPKDMCVLHKCDNRACVNIDHLFIGTHADNNIDMQKKGRGRYPSGELCKKSLLTEKQVREIKERLANGQMHREIASAYKVSRGAITSINMGKTWRHVE